MTPRQLFASKYDIADVQVERLIQLAQFAADAQTKEHNGKYNADPEIKKFESYAENLGLQVCWQTGIFPRVGTNGNFEHLPD